METDTCQGLEPAFKLLPGFSGGDGGGRKTCGWRLKEKTRVTFWSQALQVLAAESCRDAPLFPRPVPHFPYAHPSQWNPTPSSRSFPAASAFRG